MIKAFLGIGFFYLGAGLLLAAAAKQPVAPPKNMVLIGWDAGDRRNVKEYMARGDLPRLKQLADEGTIVAIDMKRFTDTKAGWVQILTGYEPEVTGVFANVRYTPVPEGYTIFERLEAFFGPQNIATVAVVGKKKHVDADPPERKKVGKKLLKKLATQEAKLEDREYVVEDPPLTPEVEVEDGVPYQKQPGKPYYLTRQHLDYWVNGLMANDAVGRRAIEKLEELGLYDDTLVYVTSDHGFMKGGRRHWDAPYVFLATNDGGVMRRGDRVDITPTLLDRYGIDLSTIEPPLDGHSLLRPYSPPLW
jgi:hypothetical protein